MALAPSRDPRFYNNPFIRNDEGTLSMTRGYDHLTKTMAIQAGYLLEPPHHGEYVNVPLLRMCEVRITTQTLRNSAAKHNS